jgi:TrkA domain protein
MHLERTTLPGVGDAVRFRSEAGAWLGVIQHHGGHRELVIYALDDADTVQTSVRLTEDEAHELAEILYSHHAAAREAGHGKGSGAAH